MTDEIDTLEPRSVQPTPEPPCQLGRGQPPPEPGQFRNVHTATFRQRFDHRPPPAPGTGEAVNEHDRLALARDTIRGRRPVDDELPNLHEHQSGSPDADS
jgi:hypothetical protein